MQRSRSCKNVTINSTLSLFVVLLLECAGCSNNWNLNPSLDKELDKENNLQALLPDSLVDSVQDDGFKKSLRDFKEGKVQINAVQNNGLTMLQNAAAEDNLEVLQALLKAGADPNTEGRYQRSALNSVSYNPAIVQALIDAGADINHQEEDGYTPLHRFLGCRSAIHDVEKAKKIIALIVDRPEANINLKNNFDQTPLAYFMGCFPAPTVAGLAQIRYGEFRSEVINYLVQHGATQ